MYTQISYYYLKSSHSFCVSQNFECLNVVSFDQMQQNLLNGLPFFALSLPYFYLSTYRYQVTNLSMGKLSNHLVSQDLFYMWFYYPLMEALVTI